MTWREGGFLSRPIVIRFTVVNTVFGIVLWIKIENDETSKWYETETNIVVSHILKIRKLNWTSISFELFAHELLIKTDKSIELIIKPKGLLAYWVNVLNNWERKKKTSGNIYFSNRNKNLIRWNWSMKFYL